MNEHTIQVGLIGYGHGGAIFHAPLIAATPGLTLSAIVTSNPERAAHARRAYPSTHVLPDTDALWQHSPRIDLVVIASPNRMHVPLGMAALAHGCGVVIDKPLAASSASARELIEDARRRGLLLTVFQNRRWDGDFLTVRRLLHERRLGEVFRFESRFERWRPAKRSGWRESGDADDAGGLLFDLGAHLIDQALLLFGPVTRVYAELDRRRPGVEVDDDAFVALTHASGVRSHLWMSVLAAEPAARMRVLGSGGTYVKYGLDVQEQRLHDGMDPREPGFGDEPPDRWGALNTGNSEQIIRTEPGSYGHFYHALVSSLRDGTSPPVDPGDALRVLEIIETARGAT